MMTDKEQIIINGEKEDCKILFRCKHIDDLAAYDMIRNGIKITPENAPIGDFELMLIENTDSPFGFSSVCKRNNKEDVWEYSGFGHSGACSIVTALLKRLDRKTQECEQKDERILELMRAYTELKEKFEALKLENQEGYEIVAELKHECEELKEFVQQAKDAPICFQCEQEPCIRQERDRYRKALEEIEEIVNEPCVADTQEDCKHCDACCEHKDILDIINKAKEEE